MLRRPVLAARLPQNRSRACALYAVFSATFATGVTGAFAVIPLLYSGSSAFNHFIETYTPRATDTVPLVLMLITQYIFEMGEGIEFNQAAFKHGITEESIRYALNNPRYEGPFEDDENKFIVIGFDNSGNLLEILYNRIDDETLNVFHAMKCRSIFYPLLDA